MTKFDDGPAAGVTLWLRRAPLFLRVTRNARGEWDALDQVTDRPEPAEELFVYRRHGEATAMHLLCGGRNRRAGGWFAVAAYRLEPDPPPEPVLRDFGDWARWCLARYRAEKPEEATDDPPAP